MKQKIVSIVIILIAVLSPLLIAPVILVNHPVIYKFWTLVIGGSLLLVLLLLNYKDFKTDKKDILLLIFLLLIMISTFLSSNIKTSLIGHATRYEGLIAFTAYALIYICTKKFFKYENYNELLNILFVIYMIIGILGIAQRYVDNFRLYPIFNKGVCATFSNSNFFASFISLVLPITIPIYIFKGNKKAFILSIVMFFNLISCLTRSAWVAFILISIVFFIYLIRQKNIKYFKRIVLLIICFLSIIIFLYNGFSFLNKRIEKNDNKNILTVQYKIERIEKEIKLVRKGKINKLGSDRVEIWIMTIKLIKQVPIFGCGTDNLFNGLREYCQEEFYAFHDRTNAYVDKAHNEYLQIAATTGIPSLIVYLAFLSLVLFSKFKTMFKDRVVLIICLAIYSYLIQAFFNISTLGVAPLLYMLLGLVDNKEFIEDFKK